MGYKQSEYVYKYRFLNSHLCCINFKTIKIVQTNENKVALISAANTGVGFQIAKALIENGYIVYVDSRDKKSDGLEPISTAFFKHPGIDWLYSGVIKINAFNPLILFLKTVYSSGTLSKSSFRKKILY